LICLGSLLHPVHPQVYMRESSFFMDKVMHFEKPNKINMIGLIMYVEKI